VKLTSWPDVDDAASGSVSRLFACVNVTGAPSRLAAVTVIARPSCADVRSSATSRTLSAVSRTVTVASPTISCEVSLSVSRKM
jgi:hypothetical protein